MNKKQIFFYSTVYPQSTGSGANVRVYSNLRAYNDLGYEVTCLLFTDQRNIKIMPDISKTKFKFVNKQLSSKLSINKEVRGALHSKYSQKFLDRIYPINKRVRQELIKNIKNHPNCIHHFEYLNTVSSIYGLKGKFIWSNHDIIIKRFQMIQKIRRSIGKGKNFINYRLRQITLNYIERKVVNSICLMLTISSYDQHWYKNKYQINKINQLPFSCAVENLKTEKNWLKDGKLRILHLGSTNSILTYSSLVFILDNIFPIMPKNLLEKIELNVVGNHPDAPYSNIIRKMANPYPNVKFFGYQKDITLFYKTNDIQIVGTQISSGIRSKIVESFAMGTPVLSSQIGARGLYGIKHDDNIMLGEKASDYIEIIEKIIKDNFSLVRIAKNAQMLYDNMYSRKVHSEKLNKLLNKYCQ